MKSISVTVTDENKDGWVQIAKRRGFSSSRAMREAMKLWTDVEDDFLELTGRLADQFNVSRSTVIQHCVWELVAREIALENMSKFSQPVELFPKTIGGKLITGEEFFKTRIAEWTIRLEAEETDED